MRLENNVHWVSWQPGCLWKTFFCLVIYDFKTLLRFAFILKNQHLKHKFPRAGKHRLVILHQQHLREWSAWDWIGKVPSLHILWCESYCFLELFLLFILSLQTTNSFWNMDEEDQLELMTVSAATASICYNPSDTTPISIPEGLSTACHPLSFSCKTKCVTYLWSILEQKQNPTV